MTRTRLALPAAVTAVLVAGCADDGRQQSVLSPSGPRAEAVIPHWNTMLWLGSAVWLVVAAAVVLALFRRHRSGESSRASLVVALAGAVIPGLVVLGLNVQSVAVLRQTERGATDLVAADGGDEDLVVEVIGHQFWWEVRYREQSVVTANEIHIPVGEPVRLDVTSEDVIHSVWAPELGGKVDMIPGRSNTTWLEADEPGTYWGQCAEFCGLQHARMRFVVVAHEPEEFRGWLDGQQQPAVEPAAPSDEAAETEALVARGREVFMSSSCVYCHTVAGTPARGDVGPDLTHLASRQTLAAGTLPNERGYLAGWVVDPQSVKPGSLMPGTDLAGDELQALLAYLESLE